MCVAMRSRNQRSCVITTAQPGKLSSASSSARRVSTSRSFRLVEQDQVAARLQHLGEVNAVALAAGQLADQLLLGAAEIEATDIGARRSLVVAHLQDVETAGNLGPDRFAIVERMARLIDVRHLHRGPDADLAGVLSPGR